MSIRENIPKSADSKLGISRHFILEFGSAFYTVVINEPEQCIKFYSL